MDQRLLIKAILSLGRIGFATTIPREEALAIFRVAHQLKVECLSILPFDLPEVGQTGIQIAWEHWFEHLHTQQFVSAAARNCRDYLQRRSAFVVPKAPEHFALKAIGIALSPFYTDAVRDNYSVGLQSFAKNLRRAFCPDDDEVFLECLSPVVDAFFLREDVKVMVANASSTHR